MQKQYRIPSRPPWLTYVRSGPVRKIPYISFRFREDKRVIISLRDRAPGQRHPDEQRLDALQSMTTTIADRINSNLAQYANHLYSDLNRFMFFHTSSHGHDSYGKGT